MRAPLLYFLLFMRVCALCVYIKSGPNQILLAGIIVNKWKVVLIAMGCWAKNNSLISSIYSAERLLPVSERIFWCDCNWSEREREKKEQKKRPRPRLVSSLVAYDQSTSNNLLLFNMRPISIDEHGQIKNVTTAAATSRSQ